MKKYFIIIFLMLSVGNLFWLQHPIESSASSITPEIIIAQIRITTAGGQFITLYNNTNGDIDLSTIQLQYFNNDDLVKATSTKLIKLDGTLPAHGYAVVDDGTIQICYQMVLDSASLGLSTTSGLLEVSHFIDGEPHMFTMLDDYVSWNKPSSGSSVYPEPFTSPIPLSSASSPILVRQAPDGSRNYSDITAAGSGGWSSFAPSNNCSAGIAGSSVDARLSGGATPIPFTFSNSSLPAIPADDNGLAAPQVSEILPNPAPPQTDADNEFIELYNSNSSRFDLSGFIIQVGTTTLHKYTFPKGTSLKPKSFKAFYSADTHLSLSNSSGQVKLLDPVGNVLGQTDQYANAKDGYAWISADGLWQWTTTPTPGAANILTPPPTTKKQSESSGVVKSANTSQPSATTAPNSSPDSPVSNLHPGILAAIGALAVVYALYEYRYDLANQLYRFRRHRTSRRAAGQAAEGWGNDRVAL